MCLWLERCTFVRSLWTPINKTKKKRFAPEQIKQLGFGSKQLSMALLQLWGKIVYACSYQKWVWLMELLIPRNWILWKFARGRSMKILSLENLSLYGMLFIPLSLFMLLTTCYLLSPIATLWTAAFTPTQYVSCHLHCHSITMLYVKGDNAVQNARQ